MIKPSLPGVLVIGALAANSNADYSFNIPASWIGGYSSYQYLAPGALTGTFTGASIDAVLSDISGAVPPWEVVHAGDLALFVAGQNGSWMSDIQLQIGAEWGAPMSSTYYWGGGQGTWVGSPVSGTVTFTSGMNMTNSPYGIWLGSNGSPWTSAQWTGTITLHGVSAVPAPGAIALLGVAGLARRRRRS